jgi:hypothetical protein
MHSNGFAFERILFVGEVVTISILNIQIPSSATVDETHTLPDMPLVPSL